MYQEVQPQIVRYAQPQIVHYSQPEIVRYSQPQIIQQQEPTIIEDITETTTTEEFIPNPVTYIAPAPMMAQQLMLQQPILQQPAWVGRTLLIRPVAAQLSHNTDAFFARMDPFVEIIAGPARYKTTVHHNGGKRPQWNETFSHPLTGAENELAIIVWDKDRKKADLVGETRIDLSQVLAHGSSSNWYELFWRGKTAGRILINLEVL